jgi:hypothetical protein
MGILEKIFRPKKEITIGSLEKLGADYLGEFDQICQQSSVPDTISDVFSNLDWTNQHLVDFISSELVNRSIHFATELEKLLALHYCNAIRTFRLHQGVETVVRRIDIRLLGVTPDDDPVVVEELQRQSLELQKDAQERLKFKKYIGLFVYVKKLVVENSGQEKADKIIRIIEAAFSNPQKEKDFVSKVTKFKERAVIPA